MSVEFQLNINTYYESFKLVELETTVDLKVTSNTSKRNTLDITIMSLYIRW